MKKKIFLLLRILIAVLLLGYLFYTIDIKEFWEQIKHASPLLISIGLALYIVTASLAIVRWKLLLDVHNIKTSNWKLTKLFFVGLFFNIAMPGLTGGDVIKAYYVSKETKDHKPEAVTTVFIDRLVGITGLIMIGIIALMFNLDNPQFRKVAVVLFCFFLLILVFTPIFLSKRILKNIPFLSLLIDKLPFAHTLKRIYDTFYKYRSHKMTVVFGLILSMMLQGANIITVYFMGRAIGLELPITYYFLFIPVISTIAALPISISGLGVNEGLYVYCFGLVGVAEPSALAISLMARFVIIIWSLPGWFFYMTIEDKNISEEEMQHEVHAIEEERNDG